MGVHEGERGDPLVDGVGRGPAVDQVPPPGGDRGLGERLPTGSRAPVCPTCKSSFLQVAYTGPVVHALVKPADPASGAQDVGVEPHVAQLAVVI
ncbi:hypothetical protein [Nonomuraea sp. NPDC049709]|uniref:hypothetical protein n=1 Tax=Nonomuraea sp. NPDC049709 TaxID=3154736 RepID=UPI0034127799